MSDRSSPGKLARVAPNRVIETTDVDHAEAALSEAYLPLRLRPRAGEHSVGMHLDAARIDRVTVGSLLFGSDIRIMTEEATNYHIDVPLSGHSRSRAGKRDEVFTSPGSAAVFMPGAPADLHWTPDTVELCLMLDPVIVERELANLLGHELKTPVRFAETMDVSTPGGRSWMRTIDLVVRESAREPGVLRYPLIARRLEQILIDGLLVEHRHNYSDELSADRFTPRDRAVRRAVELLEGRPEDSWTTRDLAAEVGLSARGLQSGFCDLTGAPPMTYLRGVRLRRTRGDLVDSNAEHTTVSQVAHLWGFTHLGRFAAAYRHEYGELPSDTLGAAAPRSS